MSDIAQLASPAPATEIAERTARVLASFWSLPQATPALFDGAATRVATDVPSRQTVLSARVRPHAGRPGAFLKMVERPTGFEAEHFGLTTARAASPPALPVRVPEVLHTVPAEHALLIEYLQGVRLSQFIRRRYLALPRWSVDLVATLGGWFAAFHAHTREQVDAHEFATGHCELIHSLITHATARGRLGEQESITAHRVLDALARSVASRPMDLAWCHADVSLNNVLVHGRMLYVIDFAKSGVHPPERDQLGFWNSLKKDIGELPFAGHARRLLWHAFKDGYEAATTTPTNTAVRDLLHLEDMTHELAYSPDPGRLASGAALRRRRLLQVLRRHLDGWLAKRASTYAVGLGGEV
jgi:tRNA A-37 threonylcarbamoyl transferase component Bud32